jgi:hypothetical protein
MSEVATSISFKVVTGIVSWYGKKELPKMLKRLARKYAPLELKNVQLKAVQQPMITLNPNDGVCEMWLQLGMSNTSTYTVEYLCCDVQLHVGPRQFIEFQRVLLRELKPGGVAEMGVRVPLTETQISLAKSLFGGQEMKSGRLEYELLLSSPFGRETIHRREEVSVRFNQLI